MGAHQRILVVQLGAGEQVQACRVDEDFGAIGGDDEVVRVLRIRQVEFILEAGTAAGEDFDTQGFLPGFGSQNFGDAAGGGVGQAEFDNFTHIIHIAHCALGLKGRAV